MSFRGTILTLYPSMGELLEALLSIALQIRESPNAKASPPIQIGGSGSAYRTNHSRQAVTKWSWLRSKNREWPTRRCYARIDTGQKARSSSILSSRYKALNSFFLSFSICVARN